MRLDEFLVKNKFVDSRNKATNLILNNKVLVNNKPINKKHYIITDKDVVTLIEQLPYVSRAGEKLACAIDTFKLNLNDKVILDIGSSTGGFCDVCLQNQAKKVYAIDVHDQLDEKIKNHPNIVNLAPINVKDLEPQLFNEPIDVVVSDISFISSKYMFEAIAKINLSNDVIVISLIKPQFELTPEIIKKGKGLVKESKYHIQAIENVKVYAKQFNFECIDVIDSPILGAKKGNKEFLGLFKIWKK